MAETESDLDQSQSRTFIVLEGIVQADTQLLTGAEARALSPGDVIDSKYKIVSLLGEGGMGSVYLVHHLFLDKDMALKTFRSRYIEQEISKRFELEARAIARLSHKNIVQVFDFGLTTDGRPYYTMELLKGNSLVKYIDDRSLTLSEILEIFQEVCDGLDHAHKAGIIHRDIKPDNIYLGPKSEKTGKVTSVKIVDFGIAKLAIESTSNNHDFDHQTQTKVGRVFGSPLYMSPEQSLGLPTDNRTDIYSLGCTLYEAITGHPPFVGANSSATLASHRLDAPPTLADKDSTRVFPQRLEGLIATLLQKDKNARPQSGYEIKHELARILRTLAKGQIQGGESIAQKAETSLNPRSARQAKTDPLIAADRAISDAFSHTPKSIIATAIVLLTGTVALCLYFGLAKDNAQQKSGQSSGAKPDNSAIKRANLQSLPLKKFLIKKTSTGRLFDFPDDVIIGRIHFCEMDVSAKGKIEVPDSCDLKLVADQGLAEHPELFTRFGPDDLKQLEFSAADIWTDDSIKWACHLTGLQSLEVDGCDITAASVGYIGTLPNLQRLAFDGLHVTASQWSRLKQLDTLKEIKAETLHNCAALLLKLKQKNNLEIVEFKGCDISDASMPIIGTFKKLTTIRFYDSQVTSKGLKQLLLLPELTKFSLSKSNVDPDCIETFVALPHLQELDLETGSWSVSNQKRLHDLMAAKNVKLKQTCPDGPEPY